MFITGRDLIRALAGTEPALKARQILATDNPLPQIQAGPFEGPRESLRACQIPARFRGAKFGIRPRPWQTDTRVGDRVR